MRLDKEKAIELRSAGKSYREISTVLGVSKATLSKWFSKEPWSKGVREKLLQQVQTEAKIRIKELNRVRGERLQKSYQTAKEDAQKELLRLQYDPLFVAGLTLYWAGGDMTSKELVRFSSMDMDKVKLHLAFLEHVCGVPKGKIRASLLVYPGQDEQSNRRLWAFALGPGVTFTKSSRVPGRHDARKLRYGICVLTVSSVYVKVKMQEWLKILPKQLIERR
jgi:transcriptional regulator with XRE-family HTH domain